MDDTLELVPAAPPDVQPAAQLAVEQKSSDPRLVWIPRILIFLLMVPVVMFVWHEGVSLRHWVWDTTAPIRYAGDIDRDYRWGRISAREGYLNQYEKMQNQDPKGLDYLDHPPLRLAALALWGKWSLEHFPKVEKWSSNHSFGLTAPLLRFDLMMEALGLIAAFMLTRLWAVRGSNSVRPGSSGPLRTGAWGFDSLKWFYRGCVPAAIAVLLLWFNPAVILSGYAWPAWDLWLIPIFLLAALLASYECWFTAGVIVGIGTMLNEHIVLAIPLFLLWNIILHGWPKIPLPRFPYGPIVVGLMLALAALIGSLAAKDKMDVPTCLITAFLLFMIEVAIVVSVLVLWSLIWRPVRPLRFAFGFVIAVAVIVSPWMLSYIPANKLNNALAVQRTFGDAQIPLDAFKIVRTTDFPAVFWVCGVLAAAVGLPFVAWLTLEKPSTTGTDPIPRWRHMLASKWAWRSFAALGTVVLVFWPWLIKRNHAHWLTGLACTVAMIVAIQLIRPRGIALLATAAVATALLLCMSVFHGSTAWYDCGFAFHTVHNPWMARGMADNLPAIMVRDFNWHRLDLTEPAFTIPAEFLLRYPAKPTEVSTGTALQTLFEITLLLCSLGAAMHARLRSSRLLVALPAIWLMLFCFPPQIHERDLVFAAGISCICIGSSLGMTLLGVFLSLAASVMMLNNLLATASSSGQLGNFSKGLAEQFPKYFSNHSGDEMLRALNGANPDLGYAVVLCGLVFLYVSLAPQRKSFSVQPTSNNWR